MASPRILVVAPLYYTDRGGLGRQAVLLTERLAALGARATVVTRRMTGLPPRAWPPGVRRIEVAAGREGVHNYEAPTLENLLTSLRFSAGLAAALVRERGAYDVVHVHGASVPLILALPVARTLGKRVVAKVAALGQGVEAGDLRRRHGPLGRGLAWWLGRVDAWVATTAEIGAALEGEGYPRARIARVPNFVDTDLFRPAAPDERAGLRAALGLDARPVVVHSGRLTARKNVDLLLEALARAAAHLPPARRPLLVLLGDGPLRPALEARAARPDLAGLVRLEGFREDVPRWLAAADLLVLPSRLEGFPNALLEGMAAGLPALATSIGGCREAITDGADGLLVAPDDVAALAAGLSRLVGDPALMARLGAAARRTIEARFTLDAVAPRYLDLYDRLLAGASVGDV
ncbi:MAG: glycosyltransferase family 4 protein [Planctomycetes bacterium]|nr:glycosyltransferase family 4 protein [Planctomycetota bacterium]